jgi:hypothetical protein
MKAVSVRDSPDEYCFFNYCFDLKLVTDYCLEWRKPD